MSRTNLLIICAAGALASTADAGIDNVLIEIDITDPTSVSIQSTGENAGADVSIPLVTGVTLSNLFVPGFNLGSGFGLSGDLTPAGSSFAYFAVTDGGESDLRLFVPDETKISDFQLFSKSTPAFSGASMANLSSAVFAPVGSTGEIFANFQASGAVIGRYRIVPAPAGAMALAAFGLVAARRCRSSHQ